MANQRASIASVSACSTVRSLAIKGRVGNGDDPGARVASRLAEHPQLLQIHGADAGLLAELTQGRLIRGFVRAHEAARQRPLVGKRPFFAPHQQNLKLPVAHGEQSDIGGHGRARKQTGIVGVARVKRMGRGRAGRCVWHTLS